MTKLFKITFILMFFIFITKNNYHMGMPAASPNPTGGMSGAIPATPPIPTPAPASSPTPSLPGGQASVTPSVAKTYVQIPKTEPLVMGLPKEENKNKEEKIKKESKPAQPSQAKPAGKQKDKEKKEIFLNFENAELSSLVNYIAEIKKINLIPDKNLAGKKISLSIRNPLTVDGAWNIFLTVLDMGGFTIVERGDVYTVVPNNAKGQPFRSFINTPFLTLPDSDEDIRYVVFLQNIHVEQIQGLLQGMLSKTSSVVPYKEVNGMVVTDKSYNIKSAMKVIQELDQTGLQETVVVMRLKQTNATDIQKLLTSLIQPGQNQQNPLARLLGRQAESSLTYFSPSTKIIAEERTNSLILMGNQKSIEKIEKFITDNLDTELKGTESPLHIYELQHTDAEQMRRILEVVVPYDMAKAKQGGIRGGAKYFKPMKFEIDKDGNRLIASSTEKQDWKMLKKTIRDLDKPQPQVAIETLILTVDFNDLKELGGALRNKHENQIGQGVNFQSPTYAKTILKGTDNSISLANMALGLTGGVGATILTIGNAASKTGIWGIFRALKQQTNTTLLSQPFFTVANNTQAEIKIGETLNVVNETTESKFKGYTERTADTTLKVTPQINLDGIIRLKIDLDFDFFTDPELGNKDTKKLVTDVSVANGQVLVLGGFIKSKTTELNNKTPLLADIPILGWMFKNKKKVITKNYLLVFMSPTIVKPRSTPGTNLYTNLKIEDATNTIRDSVQTRKTNDPIHNWFFNPEKEDYSYKVTNFASAKYQPTSVDIKNDPYYRATPDAKLKYMEKIKKQEQEAEDKFLGKTEPDNNMLDKKREQLKQMLTKNPVIKTEEPKIEAKLIKPKKRQEFKEILNIPKVNKKRNALKNRLTVAQNIPQEVPVNIEPIKPLRPTIDKNEILAKANNMNLNKLNSRKTVQAARTLKARSLA